MSQPAYDHHRISLGEQVSIVHLACYQVAGVLDIVGVHFDLLINYHAMMCYHSNRDPVVLGQVLDHRVGREGDPCSVKMHIRAFD